MDIKLINDKDQEYAGQKLAPFYENNLIPAEKKAYLTELQNNNGPFMGIESSSGKTHYLLDAASQIATLGLGFSPSVFMGTSHLLSSWTNNPSHPEVLEVKDALSAFIKRKTGWKELDTTICNSGAEANEIALGYAFQNRVHKNAKKVLAFEGSFHGRMMISLFSTWNESKREPFQWPGYETIFTKYPELPGSEINVTYPQNWRQAWDNSTSLNFEPPKEWSDGDSIIDLEIECLLKIREALLKKELFAIIIEPMQCEGGDRYSSDRFHTALLLMARAFQVEVIHDEVQTGFHLGRSFFWHRQFCLTDQNDQQISPNYLVCAKKAQVGMVLSPKKMTQKNECGQDQFQVASLVRGYLHAIALDQSKAKIMDLELKATKHLNELHLKYKQHFIRPRACGLSFAIDLVDNTNVAKFIALRFKHGLLYYPAGSNTLRFRLNTAFSDSDLKFLFERLDEISNEVFNQVESSFDGNVSTNSKNVLSISKWQNLILKERFNGTGVKTTKGDLSKGLASINQLLSSQQSTSGFEVKLINKENFNHYKSKISSLQEAIYEPTRQTDIEKFELCAGSQQGVCLSIEKEGKLAGIAFSSPLKDHPLERGLRQDLDFNDLNCLYMIDTTVDKPYQGLGLGRVLKYSLTYLAMKKGITKIKGRNRDQLATNMLNINLSIGSIEQNYLREDYPDFQEYRDVLYYQTLLNWDAPQNLSNRMNSLLEIEDIDEEFKSSQLPYLANKVCLSNFVSHRFLGHVKGILDSLPPEIRHGYTASGQSECVDKVGKSILYNFKERFNHQSKFLTFEGHYFGEGSFLSRSLSQSEREGYFPIERLPHPTSENWQSVLRSLEELLAKGEVISIWLEPVRQHYFDKVPEQFLTELKKLAQSKNVFVVYNETAAKEFSYDDQNYFASNNQQIVPDAGFSFLGGQSAIIYLREDLFISKPLMMISTWDGDEHAFATFHRGMQTLMENKSKFLEIRTKFSEELKKELKGFPLSHLHIENGRGSVSGSLPKRLTDKLFMKGEHYIIDPTFSAMSAYLESKKV